MYPDRDRDHRRGKKGLEQTSNQLAPGSVSSRSETPSSRGGIHGSTHLSSWCSGWGAVAGDNPPGMTARGLLVAALLAGNGS